MKKEYYLLMSLAVFLFSIFSCDIGMGQSVDLEAPVITITSPENSSYVHSDVTFTGTCYDNIEVISLVVTTSAGEEIGRINNPPANWTFKPKTPLPNGKMMTLIFTVYDAAGNDSINSKRQLNITIDDNNPELKKYQILRPDHKRVNFISESDVNTFDENSYSYYTMENYQNESFSIETSFTDEIGISEIEFYIYDSTNLETPILTKTLSSETYSDGSIFNPIVNITENELIQINPSYSSGIHYFFIKAKASDNNGNILADTLGYVVWYPASDTPHLIPSSYSLTGDILKVPARTELRLDVFDDDGIRSFSYKYYSEGKENSPEIQSSKDYDGVNLISPSFTTDSNFCTKYFSWKVTDINGKTTSGIIEIIIDDGKSPTLVVETPEKNTVPEFQTGTAKYSISGYGFDTDFCQTIYLAYIPYGKSFPAGESLRSELFAQAAEKLRNTSDYAKISDFYFKKGTLTPNGVIDEVAYKFDYSFDIDLLNDNLSGEKIFDYTKPQNFILQISDSNNNYTYDTCSFNPDKIKPEIEIISPNNGSVCDYFSDMNIICKISKTSKLPLKDVKFTISDVDYNLTPIKCDSTGLENSEGEYIKYSIPGRITENYISLEKFYTENKKSLVFEISAMDLFENVASKRIFLSLGNVPVLQEISSPNSNKTYGAGDVITVEVKFSSAVVFNTKPKLKVKFGSEETLLETKSNSGSDVLEFDFTVPENASGNLETLQFIGSVYSSVLRTAMATTTIPSGKQLQDSKAISLDGVKPLVNKITVSSDSSSRNRVVFEGKDYLNKDKSFLATVVFNENIETVSPVLTLNWKNTDVVFRAKTINSSSIVFEHIISDSTPELETSDTITFTGFSEDKITDIPGNEYVKNNAAVINYNVVIDVTKPVTPDITLTQSIYTENQIFEIKPEDIEDGAKVEYILNAGEDWSEYKYYDENWIKPVLEKGNSYSIRTRQTDIAGNISLTSETKKIVIEGFPALQSFALISPDGINTANTISFKMSFASKVNVPANSAEITFSSIGNCTGASKNITVKNKASNSQEVEFEYTIGNHNIFQGLEVSKVTFTSDFKDTLGNEIVNKIYKNNDNSPLISRPNFYYDKVRPVVESKTENIADSTDFAIVLDFSEDVTPEYGTVNIERKGDWLIPPVLTVEEFNKIYNALTDDADKAKLLETEIINGEKIDVKNDKTGISKGPYKKITHGLLKDEIGNLSPDISTKYVLDFEKSLDDLEIRAVLAKTGYHQHSVDITNSSNVSSAPDDNSKWIITFPEKIPQGIEWSVTIPEGAFIDHCGNKSQAINIDSLWSAGVSTPVVRVDRYSHGYGAKEPDSQGNFTEITVHNEPKGNTAPAANSGGTIKPSGYVRVRIDSQTPGVEIKYKCVGNASTSLNDYKFTTGDKNSTITIVTGKKYNDINFSYADSDSTIKTYNGYIYVGDDDPYKSRKDYISAISSINHGFGKTEVSELGYEGAFRTVLVVYDKISWSQSQNNVIKTVFGQLNVEGGTSEGGRPSYDGFPLRDGYIQQYSKNMYHDTSVTPVSEKFSTGLLSSKNVNCYVWLWNSYDILIDNCALLLRCGTDSTDGSRNSSSYPKANYGEVTYLYNYPFYK